MAGIAITTFAPSQRDAIASLLDEGIIEQRGDLLHLTERGAAMVATECGWVRGEDADGDECFMHTGSYNTFSYVGSWLELVTEYRLATLTVMERVQ